MIDGLVLLSAVLSGAAIGLILGLVGGGGSILAVPLLVHVVGIRSPHVAIASGVPPFCLSRLRADASPPEVQK